MGTLTPNDLIAARRIAIDLSRGDRLTQAEIHTLCTEWEPKVKPSQKEHDEWFSIARPDGTTRGVVGPRWLFHLLGLRHRAAEVALSTPTGLIVLQRRSPVKDEWPDALDMAVAGHIPQRQDGGNISFEEGAWREIGEEIGLDVRDAASVFVEGRLEYVGDPYFCYEADPERNPPFVDAEVRQVFAATLTGEGLARLHFADGEVAGIVLASLETAWQVLRTDRIASGLRYSLPRYLDWLEQRRGEAA